MLKSLSAKLWLASGSAAVMAACLASPVLAADANANAGSGDVVVTAQFREQNLQQTPIAITAVNAQTLEQRSQTNLVQVAQQAPNVTLQPGTGSFGPTMQTFIRGVGQADFNFAFEPGVGVYIDDVYFSTTLGSMFDLLDLDRVEILRGPQGTLAGMNSIGGSIKLYSKKPNGQGGGYLQGTYGSFNRAEVRGSADFTVIPDQLFMRIAGVAKHSDGYVTRYDYACTHPALAAQYAGLASFQTNSSCKLGTEGGKAYEGIRAALRWAPNEKLEVNLIGDYTHDRSEAIPQTLLYVGAVAVAPTAPWYTLTAGVPTGTVPGVTGPTCTTNGATVTARCYPQFTTAPTTGANNGLYLWNATTGTSPFITSSPFGNFAGDPVTHSPYVNYSTYQDTLPSDGTPPWNAEPAAWVSGWGVSGQVDYKLTEDLKFTSVTSYRRYSAYWAQDYDASPLGDGQLTYDIWHWQLQEEARLSGRLFNDRVDWVLGGFYFDQKSHYGGRNELGTTGEFIEDDIIPATNSAVFANVDWRVTDRLELNGGIRYSMEDKTFIFGRGGIIGNNYPACVVNGVSYGKVAPAFCNLNGVSGSFSGDRVDWRAVAQYQWTDAFMTYASVATGFKGGGINPRPFQPTDARPFDPETLTSYELGFKSNLFDRRVRLNVSIFDSEYNGFIAGFTAAGVATQNPPNPGCFYDPTRIGFCSYQVNAGNARFQGAEAEVQARPIDHLTIDGSISYLNFKWKSLTGCSTLPGLSAANGACAAGQTPGGGLGANIRYGMQAPFSPKWKYSIGAQYEIGLGGWGSVTPRLDYSYQGDFYASAINNIFNHVPAYHLLNGRVTWRPTDGMWDASLEVTNLENNLYYTGFFANSGTRTVTGSPARPREWAVTVKRRF
jgi:iron complex outermembrane receptor protein